MNNIISRPLDKATKAIYYSSGSRIFIPYDPEIHKWYLLYRKTTTGYVPSAPPFDGELFVEVGNEPTKISTDEKLRGGKGSGFHSEDGHKGRIGQVGGSASDEPYLDLGSPTRIEEEATVHERMNLWYSEVGADDYSKISGGWIAGGNKDLSRYLRRGNTIPKGLPKTIKLLDDMDEYFSMSPLKLSKNILVYRGIGFGLTDPFAELKVGDVFYDKSFVSTSLSRSTASAFSSQSDVSNIFKIKVQKGTPFLPGSSLEYEFILNKNSKFKVNSITEYDSAKKYPWMMPGDLRIREIEVRLLK